jgi:hypothetical protein
MGLGIRLFFFWSFYILEYALLALLSAVCFSLDLDLPEDLALRKPWHVILEFAKANAAELGVVLGVLALTCRFTKWLLRSPDENSKIVDRLTTQALDEFRARVFPDVPKTEPQDKNRVTIFRYRTCVWWIWPFRGRITPWGGLNMPWSGWLVVVQRSGHLTQNRTAVFLAPDDADQCEGVAGRAWRGCSVQVGTGNSPLPDLRGVKYVGLTKSLYLRLLNWFGKNSHEVNQFLEDRKKVHDYAAATACSHRFVWERLRRGKSCPTSIVAVPLSRNSREPWGVLVIDSQNHFQCLDVDNREFRAALKALVNWLADSGVIDLD